MDNNFTMRDEYFDRFDADKICSLLKEAWDTMPDATLHEILNEAIPADLESLEGFEVEELLEEFIHQNS